MDKFNGIEIGEYKLVVHYVLFILLLVVLLAATLFLIHQKYGGGNKKDRERIINLKIRAKTDVSAQKALEKLERKNKRRRERKKSNIIIDILFLVLVLVLSTTIVFQGIAPALTDHIEKDYAVYTGRIEVRYSTTVNRSYILLVDEALCVRGSLGFGRDDTYGTIVYSTRSLIALGGRK